MTENRKRREFAKYSLKQQMQALLKSESLNFEGQPYSRTIAARLCILAESDTDIAPFAALAISEILKIEG